MRTGSWTKFIRKIVKMAVSTKRMLEMKLDKCFLVFLLHITTPLERFNSPIPAISGGPFLSTDQVSCFQRPVLLSPSRKQLHTKTEKKQLCQLNGMCHNPQIKHTCSALTICPISLLLPLCLCGGWSHGVLWMVCVVTV